MFLIRKYILKEIFLHFGAIFAVLFFIFSSNQLITLLTNVASGKLSTIILGKLMLLYTPEIFGFLIPISLFIAILFCISKLYADNEIIVLFISGIIWGFLIKTIVYIAIFFALINAFITLWLIPSTTEIREKMIAKSEASLIGAIIPGQFNVMNDGKQVFYVEEIKDNKFSDIFIATNADDLLNNSEIDKINIITAKSGYIKTDDKLDQNSVTLLNGYKYSGLLNNKDFFIINFNKYVKNLLQNDNIKNNFLKIKKSREIFRSKFSEEIAEFQWRMSMPISTIVLSLLAIGLSKVMPRQGRFAKVFPAILLYIIYSNTILFMRRLVAINGYNNYFISIWMVHLIFFIISIMLLLQISGWFLYFRNKYLNFKF